MNHKIIRTFIFITTLVFVGNASAQVTDTNILEDQLLADARELLQSGRKEIIEFELQLTDEEAAGFWSVYSEYHEDVMEVRDHHVDTLGDYLKTYRAGEVTETYAASLLDKGLDFKSDLLKVQKKYLKRFKKVLPMRKVARFYQLENKMDAEIDAQLAIAIPLMDPV
jgi:hypothetical protein